MAKAKTVWGIDIGQCALKALKLRIVEGQLQVEAFDVIEHAKILSQPEVDRAGMIRTALEQFQSRNNLEGSMVCVSVPGQSSFTRFVKLPPVEPKKIPDIVRFEAEQQIPFPITEVIWRWQIFSDPDSPDVEVGIFAMKRSDIAGMLENFTGVQMPVEMVQMAPLALYNFLNYDEQLAGEGATLLADVGANKTDLVVADGSRIWTRTIQIGGNNFTEALMRAFKLSFSKAEKLKRTAASSKYARQIFQAMRPVFADLVQEIQRSVGYYTSLHRESRFKRLVGLGNGFRLPGLQKFLEQNLNIPVVRIDNYSKLQISPAVNAPVFAENVLSFGVSYGLAVQGLGLAAVSTDLLPAQIARVRRWQEKRPWFGAAAAVLLLTLLMPLFRNFSDKSTLADSEELRQASTIAKQFRSLESDYGNIVREGEKEDQRVEQIWQLYKRRDYWPELQSLISEGIRSEATDQQLLAEYANAATEKAQRAVLEKIARIPRASRRMVFIEQLDSVYYTNVMDPAAVGLRTTAVEPTRDRSSASRKPSREKEVPGFKITITGRTPLPREDALPFLNQILRRFERLGENTDTLSVLDFEIVPESRKRTGSSDRSRGQLPMHGSTEQSREKTAVIQDPDPMFPDDPNEDRVNDTQFTIAFVVSIGTPDATGTSSGGRPGR